MRAALILLSLSTLPYIAIQVNGKGGFVDLITTIALGLTGISSVVLTVLSRSLLVALISVMPSAMFITKFLVSSFTTTYHQVLRVEAQEGLPSLVSSGSYYYVCATLASLIPIPVCAALGLYYLITKSERSHVIAANVLLLGHYVRLCSNTLPPLLLASSIALYATHLMLHCSTTPTLAAVNTALAMVSLPSVAAALRRDLVSLCSIAIMLAAAPFNAAPLLAAASMVPPQLAKMIPSNGSGVVKLGRVKAVLERYPPVLTKLKLGGLEAKAMKWWWHTVPKGIELGLNFRQLPNPHVVVNGSSGTGKSFAAASMAKKLASAYNVTVLIIDPHGEYLQYLNDLQDLLYVDASKGVVNPLHLSGSPPSARARQVVELVRAVYRIGPLQTRILEEAIISAYAERGIVDEDPSTWSREPPSVEEVIKVLASIYAKEMSSAESLIQYLAELRTVAHARISPTDLINRNVIIDLSKLPSRFLQLVVGDTVMRLLMYELVKRGFAANPRKLLVVDEAHIFSSAATNVRTALEQAVAEMRKYGLMIVIVSQSPRELGDTVMTNTATKLFLALYEPQSANYAAEILCPASVEDKREAIKLALAKLGRGEAVVRVPQLDEPVIIELS